MVLLPRSLFAWLGLASLVGCNEAGEPSTEAGTSGADPVSYAACDDVVEGCAPADCLRRDDAAGSWSICSPVCTEDADCPVGAGGNIPVVCDPQQRCVLECVPEILSCPSGTTCVDGDVAQCMWPAP